MKRRTDKNIRDEIKRLNRLIRKNNADKRNEVRQEKVKTLKEIAKLNKALKSKKVSTRQYLIQYKDYAKKLKATRRPKVKKITKKDLSDNFDNKVITQHDRYVSIFKWNNTLGNGIIGAFARGGRLDDILGFDVGSYWGSPANNKEILNYLYDNKEFYDLLDQYFIIGSLTFEDIIKIMSQTKYRTDVDELFYRDPDDPEFDISYFENQLTDFVKKIRKDYYEEVVV